MQTRPGMPDLTGARPAKTKPAAHLETHAMRVSDAPANNWVDRHAPASWRSFLRMSRADRPIGTWLLLLPCWWGLGLAMMADAPRWWDLWIAVACAVGACVMRGAGCTWNDITDRDIDAQVARTRSRPLPSGQVSLRGAYRWLVAQALVGLAVLVTLGPATMVLGLASVVPAAIYPFSKRFTWWPQLFLGVAFNWGVLLAYGAHMGRLDAAPFLAYLAGIAWTIFYDTIYAHQDVADDALIGVRSTARLFADASPRIVAGFALISVVLLGVAVALAAATTAARVAGGMAVAGFTLHLILQLRRFDPADGAGCLRVFWTNRDAGLIVAVLLAVAGFM